MATSGVSNAAHRRSTGSCVFALVLGAAVALLATTPPPAGAQTIPSAQTVLSALHGTLEGGAAPGSGNASPSASQVLFAAPEPDRLRPCCAFGGEMRVKLVGIPLPWYRHKPLRGPGDIGPHEYDPGVLQLRASPVHTEGQSPKREHNGIVYTCRGGFLDTAHIRDFADHAWFLAGKVEPLLETGGTFDLLDYGGRRRVTIRPVPAADLRSVGRTRLAIAVAGRLSFDLSVWREIATWYGYESVPPWPEKLSSFSPEDLYSNLLGTKIAEGILTTQPIGSRRDWDLAMTVWLASTLETLGVVPVETAREMMKSVDELFWSSSHWIPDWKITRRRKFDRGPSVEPWVVHTGGASGSVCGNDAPVALPVSDTLGGVAIDDVGVIDVVVSDWLLRHDFPLPREGDRHIVEADFAELISSVQRATDSGLRESEQGLQAARLD